MSKKLNLLILLLPLWGMSQSFQKKQIDLNLGLGLGNTFVRSGTYSVFPPISTSLDIGVTDNISVGGYLAYTAATWKYSGWDYCNNGNGVGGNYHYDDVYRESYYIFGVRGAFHFAEFIDNDKIDLYLGLMLGDNYVRNTYSTTSPCPDRNGSYYSQTRGGFIFSGFAGCRYRFTEKVGIFAELGYGITYLNLGLNLKLQ